MFIRQQQRNRPNHTFKDWLKSPIETINGLVYDVKQESYKPLTHRDFVNSVYADIIGIINKNGHTITYKKAFKIKLAKILYSLSDNSTYGPTL
jgi:hypothetical protein